MSFTIIELFLVCVVSGVGAYVGTYLRKKGEHLATKEDIGEITNVVESVKQDFALVREAVRSRNELKTVALEKRLEVHQQAFTLWRGLMFNVFDDSVHQRVLDCQDFWEKNCVYMSPAVNEAFSLAYNMAGGHKQLVESFRGMGGQGKDAIFESMGHIKAAGNVILAAMELPPLRDPDVEKLTALPAGSAE